MKASKLFDQPLYKQEPDPWDRLAGAVLLRAIFDLRSPDLLTALDAALWLAQDGQIWAGAGGLETDVLKFLASGAKLPVQSKLTHVKWFRTMND